MSTKFTRLFLCFGLLAGILSQPAKAQYFLEDRWPNLRFILPVGMYPAPDQSKRIFVLEQNGRIKLFKDSGTVGTNDTSLFLNIRALLPGSISPGDERGLLGMAFHPNFSTNGYVFVNYTRASPSLTTIVSRFKVDSQNPNRLNPSSEKILLSVPQPFSNHNAGAILFGDDGYLYVTMGDGGSGGDPGNRAQNKENFLGKILRLDVDVPDNNPTPYAIPPTNPFAGSGSTTIKKEIAVTGMRNPWKISKDPSGPTIWIADVGQNQIEEVDTFRLGANYGWKVMEGNNSYSPCGTCDTSNYEKPVWAYNRSFGNSITGGFVYRGNDMPPLQGAYVYGDYGSRRVWSLKRNATGAFENTEIISATGGSLSSFGLDHANELYVIRYTSTTGKLMRVRCGPPVPTISVVGPVTVCEGDSIVLNGPTGGVVSGYRWSTGDTNSRLVLRNPGTYQIRLQTRNAFGCLSSESVLQTLTIRPRPILTAVIPAGFCPGDSATVNLAPGLTYSWTNGNTTNNLVIPSAGSYWLVGQDASGCRSDTTFFTLSNFTVPPTPTLQWNGSELTTQNISGASYQWILNGTLLQNTNDSSFQVTQPGIYQVVVVSSQGCRSDSSLPLVVTRVSGLSMRQNLVLTPNPARDQVVLSIPEEWQKLNLELEILDAQGKTVRSVSLNHPGTQTRIDVSKLPPATYSLVLRNQGKQKRARLVKVGGAGQ
jgi:glucose/arabinose dehydrogenase